MIAVHFIDLGMPWFALALVFCLDTYLRVGELCKITAKDLLRPPAPLRALYEKGFTLQLFPQTDSSRSKTGQADLTLRVDDVSRRFLTDVCSIAVDMLRPEQHLFPFEALEFAAKFQKPTTFLRLEALRMTPHSLRHGGACVSGARKLRPHVTRKVRRSFGK